MSDDAVPVAITRTFLITGLFAVVGPPVGLIALLVGETLRSWPGLEAFTPQAVWHMITSAFEVLPFAYFLGVVPAIAAGLIIAVYMLAKGRAPWWLALAVGIVIGVAFLWFVERRPPSSTASPSSPPLGTRLVFITVNVAPTMLCWWIVRNWGVQRFES